MSGIWLPQTSETQVRGAFARYGKVGKISMDNMPHDDGSYAYCFVEMPFDNQASLAIKELGGKKLGDSVLTVRESGIGV